MLKPTEYSNIKSIDASGMAVTFSTTRSLFMHIDYSRIATDFGIGQDCIVRANQKHTDIVLATDLSHGGENVLYDSGRGGFDGIVTNVPGLMLTVGTADCVPVFILDPVGKAVGMVHSGWKGTAMEISAKAVKLMHDTYGTDPGDVYVGLGPSICRECYEVSDDLIEAFSNNYSAEEMTILFSPTVPGHYTLDLKKAIKISLKKIGVVNIEDTGRCTYHEGIFHSRRIQNKVGEPPENFLSGIMLIQP